MQSHSPLEHMARENKWKRLESNAIMEEWVVEISGDRKR